MSRIYLDHAATTPLSQEAFDVMKPYMLEDFGNASSIYREGQIAREALDDSKLTLSQSLECKIDEIIVTSGATESNNLAIKGVTQAWKKRHQKIPHVISTSIEHSSVLNVLKNQEENKQIELTLLPVNSEGIIEIEDIKAAKKENTMLVSIIAVNNEVGSIQPLSRIGRWCEKNEILFHIDAVQAPGHIFVSCTHWKCDLLSLSAHKFYGPKGVGALYIKGGTEIEAQIIGGGQERNYRSGTENVAGFVGLTTAFLNAQKTYAQESDRLREMQIYGKQEIETHIPQSIWNGPEIGKERSSANLHFSFPHIDGESLLMRLDLAGVSVSLGSACSSGLVSPSHVLTAMGKNDQEARSGLRITTGKMTTLEDFKTAIEIIIKTVQDLEKSSFF